MSEHMDQTSKTTSENTETSQNGAWSLLGQRRFGPYFLTQFLGAFNDNVFRWALSSWVTFTLAQQSDIDTGLLVNLAGGLFILPFFLFSALGGQLADKYEKGTLIRWIKAAEVCIMSVAVVGFIYESVTLLFVVLFLMGTQSAFFGPVKYSLLPQHLNDKELVGGNALVEMGTFLAILFGTIAGSWLINLPGIGAELVSATLMSIAFIGLFSSQWIPPAASNAPDLKVSFNIAKQSWSILQAAQKERTVFFSILGVSWFWFLGATYLAQLPVLVRDNLGGNEDVFTLCLAVFSIGIGLGSMLCEYFCDHRVEIGLVPLGSIGLSIFGLDLYFSLPIATDVFNLTISQMLAQPQAIRAFIDIMLIGVAGGFYIVPLYALIQQRSDPEIRSRIIAANNIINAFFMVCSAMFAISMLSAGLQVPEILLVIAVMNIAVAIFIYGLVPEFLLRFLAWMLMSVLYRVRKKGVDHIPEEGPAVLVCNHISYVDALIIMACVRRPIRFVMYYRIFQIPVMGFLFKGSRAIPIAGQKENPDMLNRAMREIDEALAEGELLCIFPEGKLTADGEIDTFRPGIERIISKRPVPVVPMALRGLWGSLFSRRGGRAIFKRPRRLWARIELFVAPLVAPQEVSAADLQTRVEGLRGDRR